MHVFDRLIGRVDSPQTPSARITVRTVQVFPCAVELAERFLEARVSVSRQVPIPVVIVVVCIPLVLRVRIPVPIIPGMVLDRTLPVVILRVNLGEETGSREGHRSDGHPHEISELSFAEHFLPPARTDIHEPGQRKRNPIPLPSAQYRSAIDWHCAMFPSCHDFIQDSHEKRLRDNRIGSKILRE
jgi:hypothetical protein